MQELSLSVTQMSPDGVCVQAGDAREVSVSFLVGYPKWKVRCSTTTVSLSEDAKVEIDQ